MVLFVKEGSLLFLELNPEHQNQFPFPATWPRNSVRVSKKFGDTQRLTNFWGKIFFELDLWP